VLLVTPSPPLAAARVILSILMPVKAKLEERGHGEIFGGQHANYARRVGPYFPKVGS
jgi:protein-S-isoprenylcysteine O-methyltransferase Ste14